MSAQPGLFDEPSWPPVPPRRPLRDEAPPRLTRSRPSGLQERFEAFHQANPHVLDELVDLAREVHASGHDRWGIVGLFEVVRYQHRRIRTDDPSGDEWRLNNSYRSRYARLILEVAPDLPRSFFELRELRSP